MNMMKNIFQFCHYFHQNLQLYIFWPLKLPIFQKSLILGLNFQKICIFGLIFKIYNKFWSRKLIFGASTLNFKNDHFLTIISSKCNWSLEPCPILLFLRNKTCNGDFLARSTVWDLWAKNHLTVRKRDLTTKTA